MRQTSLVFVVLLSGCAANVVEARLAAEVDPALARGDVAAAVAAYEKLGASEDVRPRHAAEVVLWRALESKDAAERERATAIAAEVADPTLDRVLVARLDDPDLRVRARAASALAAQLEPARARLLAILDGPDAAARARAIDGLGALPDGAERAVKLLSDASPEVRARAASALPSLAVANAREVLRGLLRDPDAGVRAAALGALGAVGDRGAADEVSAALDDPALGVRLAALGALARLAGDPDRLALIASRDDHFLALRAAVALAHRGRAAAALEVVARAANDRRADARAAAMNAAGELGDGGAELAARFLRDPDLDVRLAAARALISAGRSAAALPVLAAALGTPRALDAADELARLGDARGLDRLRAGCASADSAERRAALALFAPLPGALPALMHALADTDAGARLTAAHALLRRAYRPYLLKN